MKSIVFLQAKLDLMEFELMDVLKGPYSGGNPFNASDHHSTGQGAKARPFKLALSNHVRIRGHLTESRSRTRRGQKSYDGGGEHLD